jgi:uncharacterized protein with von Willebrand factor type A (vWA) domain
MSLLDRHVEFVGALRAAGLPVSVSESLDAAAAVQQVPLLDREAVRAAYACAVVKRSLHRASFDTVFDLFFPAVTGTRTAADGDQPPEPDRTETAPRWDQSDAVRDRLRQRLRDYLRTGDDLLARTLARDAVSGLGSTTGTRGGRGSWSRLAVLDRMSPQTLMAELLAGLLAEQGSAAGGLDEQTTRAEISRRIGRFGDLVDSDVRRRLAEAADPATIARTATRPSIDRVAFLTASADELAALRREIAPLARRLGARLALRRHVGRRGPLDLRRTIRHSLETGGVPVQTVQRPRRPTRADVVILCDLSSSVAAFARFTLLLVYALREQFSRVRTFAFIDELDEVTPQLAAGTDVADAVDRLLREARIAGFAGRTDYGRALELFVERHDDVVGRRTALLVLGDARSNYGDLSLPLFERLVERAHRTYWLNPERHALWGSGDSAAPRYAAVAPMVECRNLAQLSAFVRELDRTLDG